MTQTVFVALDGSERAEAALAPATALAGLGRLAVGSVTTRAVRHASSPVFVTGPRYGGGG